MAQSRFFELQVEGPVTIVKFTERHLNDNNIQQIGDELSGLADQLGQGELHLDFSEVEYLSTVVMAKMLSIHKRVTNEGGRFVLTNLAALYELFSVTKLDRLMEVHREQPPGNPPSEKPPPP